MEQKVMTPDTQVVQQQIEGYVDRQIDRLTDR